MKAELIECKKCEATGIYIGFAERNGAGVICNYCKGLGSVVFEYQPFIKRRPREEPKITRVYEANPGFAIGENKNLGLNLESFGGMPYEDWLQGKPFPEKSEMRNYVCPKWWEQCTGKSKVQFSECSENIGSPFSSCSHFKNKTNCWARADQIEERRIK